MLKHKVQFFSQTLETLGEKYDKYHYIAKEKRNTFLKFQNFHHVGHFFRSSEKNGNNFLSP